MSVDEWNDAALRRLWDEYKRADTTQKQLCQTYGLPRYRIGALLRLASDKFSIVQPDFSANGLNWKPKPMIDRERRATNRFE